MLCLLVNGTFEFKWNSFDRVRQLLKIHFHSIAAMLRHEYCSILLSQSALALKINLRRWHHSPKLELMGLTEACLPHVIQNCLLEVNVEGLACNKTTFIK